MKFFRANHECENMIPSSQITSGRSFHRKGEKERVRTTSVGYRSQIAIRGDIKLLKLYNSRRLKIYYLIKKKCFYIT